MSYREKGEEERWELVGERELRNVFFLHCNVNWSKIMPKNTWILFLTSHLQIIT